MQERQIICAKEFVRGFEGQSIEGMTLEDYDALAEAHDPNQRILLIPHRAFFDVRCTVEGCDATVVVSSHRNRITMMGARGLSLCERRDKTNH